MFDNIGSKIKGLATVIAIGGIIVSIILGVIDIVEVAKIGKYASNYGVSGIQSVTVWSGILKIVIGSVISYVGSFTLYGFGELVDCAQKIEKNISSKSVGAKSSLTRSYTPARPAESTSKTLESFSNEETNWHCPNCGIPVSSSLNKCPKCQSKKP